MRYKYYINLIYKPKGGDNIQIPDENVRRLFIDHNYSDYNMATMYCTLNIDKTLFDRIVLGAKTDTIYLMISKVDADSEVETKEVVYEGDCEYFLRNDINYNKDLDYRDDQNKKDVYTEVNIGLMFKSCIEANKKTTNKVVRNTSMLNIVAEACQDYPLLIEPFEYNYTFKQFIIPPKDSLSQLITFLNETKVFYSTQYRLFIEPDCMYIVSSSGKPTKRKDEVYDTVTFRILEPTSMEGATQGQYDDDKHNTYLIWVNALDSQYNVDANIAKQFNQINAIINPSKENSLSMLSDMQKVMGDISSIGNSVSDTVKQTTQMLKDIPSSLSKIKIELNQESDNVSGVQSQTLSGIREAEGQIRAMPDADKPIIDPKTKMQTGVIKGLSPEKKKEAIQKLEECASSITNGTSQYNTIKTEYPKSVNNIIGMMGTVTNLPSYVNGVSPVNMKGNVGGLTKAIKSIKGLSNNEVLRSKNILHPYVDTANSLVSSCDRANSVITSTGIEPNKVQNAINSINAGKNVYVQTANRTSINIATHSNIPIKFTNLQPSLAPLTQKYKKINMNLKEQFTSLKEDIRTLGAHAKSMLKQIQSRAKDAASVLSGSGINMGSINRLKSDINAIADMTNIGKSGISKFDTKLNLGRGNEGTGATTVQVRNDNPNKIKNIKFELENKINTLSLNKNDVDCSIFTINKKYIIQNFITHSDKDGLFILDRKLDIFMREDKRFLCNCQMRFRLLKELENTDKQTTQPNPSNEDIVKQSKNTNKYISNDPMDYVMH